MNGKSGLYKQDVNSWHLMQTPDIWRFQSLLQTQWATEHLLIRIHFPCTRQGTICSHVQDHQYHELDLLASDTMISKISSVHVCSCLPVCLCVCPVPMHYLFRSGSKDIKHTRWADINDPKTTTQWLAILDATYKTLNTKPTLDPFERMLHLWCS